MRCSRGEHLAGQVLGNPFHESPGSAYQEKLSPPMRTQTEEDWEVQDSEDNEQHRHDSGDSVDQIPEPRELNVEESDEEKTRCGEIERREIEGMAHEVDSEEVEDLAEGEETEDEAVSKEEDDWTGSGEMEDENTDGESGDDDEEAWEDVEEEQEEEEEEGEGKENLEEGEEVKSKRNSNQEAHSAFQEWIAIVQDYSQRALSQPGNILVALSALAQEYKTQYGTAL